jgi:hypothetical protein
MKDMILVFLFGAFMGAMLLVGVVRETDRMDAVSAEVMP